ncbi:histidinol phosphate aminotransferase 1 [Striga asiatica]|uniref:Histidinol phosphate aminotransferase 1 n=1 Tax=Striga asiatica TaxID=4170 RepID=A0A5A7Q2F9_STRAF|nr:histidinol phosphate aminotransferase 1 [Striga asiatica]
MTALISKLLCTRTPACELTNRECRRGHASAAETHRHRDVPSGFIPYTRRLVCPQPIVPIRVNSSRLSLPPSNPCPHSSDEQPSPQSSNSIPFSSSLSNRVVEPWPRHPADAPSSHITETPQTLLAGVESQLATRSHGNRRHHLHAATSSDHREQPSARGCRCSASSPVTEDDTTLAPSRSEEEPQSATPASHERVTRSYRAETRNSSSPSTARLHPSSPSLDSFSRSNPEDGT